MSAKSCMYHKSANGSEFSYLVRDWLHYIGYSHTNECSLSAGIDRQLRANLTCQLALRLPKATFICMRIAYIMRSTPPVDRKIQIHSHFLMREPYTILLTNHQRHPKYSQSSDNGMWDAVGSCYDGPPRISQCLPVACSCFTPAVSKGSTHRTEVILYALYF